MYEEQHWILLLLERSGFGCCGNNVIIFKQRESYEVFKWIRGYFNPVNTACDVQCVNLLCTIDTFKIITYLLLKYTFKNREVQIVEENKIILKLLYAR